MTIPAVWARSPRIHEMSERQIQVVLSRNDVARMAFIDDGRVQIRPMHFVFVDGRIYGRTSWGAAQHAWSSWPEVALEVDEVDDVTTWRSVLLRGRVHLLDSASDNAEYARAVDALRTLIPGTLTERDPLPWRRTLFRIEIDEISGREAKAT